MTLKYKTSLHEPRNPYLDLLSAAYSRLKNISKTFEEMVNRYFFPSRSQPSLQTILKEVQSLVNNHPNSLVIVQRWLTQQRDDIVATLAKPDWRLSLDFKDRSVNFLPVKLTPCLCCCACFGFLLGENRRRIT
ncbi:hypothetical protein [Coxiella endosymbiont of Ornithodoros maritimus]|uniref:hypothetical protein n=1 Tax=Coxiella endosymbiont of Ornithodoros maritimus TaxID=1656172 RepID=UPI002263AFCE|nr:hypothetical protein [Coxiella endosymbiont of Ornithodoros maritimus]